MDRMSYIGLRKTGRKVVIELTVGTTMKEFPATPAGAKQVAKLLVKHKAESLLHSSSLDHYEEYGVKFDILDVVGQEWHLLSPAKPVGWWVLWVAAGGINLIKIGKGNEPFDTIEEAVRKIEMLKSEPGYMYLAAVFANGQMNLTKVSP